MSDVTVVSTMRMFVDFDIAADAPLGPANVTVTTSGGTSNAQIFTVTRCLPPWPL